ncbi:TetR/AcrR family transcriptional regulator [Endozoicomonadaceae bacterium StTr2]
MPSETFLRLPQHKQEAIVQAAVSCFTAKTYEQASVVSICKAAGLPRVTFYSYFSSLADIYQYIYSIMLKACNDAHMCDIDAVQMCEQSMELNDDLTEAFFFNLIDSTQGLRLVYESINAMPAEQRLASNLCLSLAMQYKLKIISRVKFRSELSELLTCRQ